MPVVDDDELAGARLSFIRYCTHQYDGPTTERVIFSNLQGGRFPLLNLQTNRSEKNGVNLGKLEKVGKTLQP